MSRHQEWKMIHLLYLYARRGDDGQRRVLTELELTKAGVHCDVDTWAPMENAGILTRDVPGSSWHLPSPK